jgi:hypothetical protein
MRKNNKEELMEIKLEDFVKTVQTSDNDFTMQINYGYEDDYPETRHFIQTIIGNKKFIYGIEVDDEYPSSFFNDKKMELIAVKAEDGTVYFYDENGMLGLFLHQELYQRGIESESLRGLMYKTERDVVNVFKELADATPYLPTEEQTASVEKRAYRYAKELKQQGIKHFSNGSPLYIQSDELLYIICGYETPEQYIGKYGDYLSRKISDYHEEQAFQKAVNAYLKDPNLLVDKTDKKKEKSDYERD